MKKLEISKKDLKNNIDIVKQIALSDEKGKNLKIIAVVKANGIGLDIVKYSKTLIENGINILAVAQTEEAIRLREAGITEEIIMLSPTIIKKELQLLVENDITLTIGSLYELELIENLAEELEKENINAHIKIDTGLARFGILYNNLQDIISIFENCKKVKIAGMFTHFSNANNEKWTNLQFNRFIECIENVKSAGYIPGIVHCSESTAFLKYPKMRLDAVRLGSVFQGRTLVKVKGLIKLGSFKTSIIEIKTLPKGYNISYGNICKTKRITQVAIIPVGYMDGFNKDRLRDDFTFKNNLIAIGMEIKKLFKNNSLKVKINNNYYKVIGRLGMYHSIIDITGNENIKIGDEVTLNITPLQTSDEIRREYV